MDDKKKSIEQIINLMLELDVSAYRLAKETGISEAGIGKILNGKSQNPHNRTLSLLLNYLLNKQEEQQGKLAFEREKRKLEERALKLSQSHFITSITDATDDAFSKREISKLKDEVLDIMRENRELLKEISSLKDRIIQIQSEQNAIKSTTNKPKREATPELIKK